MPADAIRTQRRFGVTAELTSQQRAELARLRLDPSFPLLLDVLEMACIEQEGILVNTDVSEPAKIVAEHRKSQSMWQMFTHFQERIDNEIRIWNAAMVPESRTHFTEEEMRRDEVLDPTRHYNRNQPPRP